MTSPASTQARRRGIVAATVAVLAAVTIAALAVTGSSRADATQQRPVQAFGSVPRSPVAAMALRDVQLTGGSAGALIYRDGRYTPLDSLAGLPTVHTGINDRGQVTGSYLPSGGTPRGFIRDASGRYTSFDAAPGALTAAYDINDQGEVVGTYAVAGAGAAQAQGFVRSPDGAVATFNVPGSRSTSLLGVSNSGAVAGTYTDAQGLAHSFTLDKGTVTTIDPPGAATDSAASDAGATGINDQGEVVGYYADATGTYHGYLYDQGRFTRLDPPGAANVPNFATTTPWGINDRGQVVGQYVDAAAVLHGYLWQPGRGFTTIDPPQITSFNYGVPGAGTIAADINDLGQILLPLQGFLYKGRAVTISG